mgnify:CR=1 FL=1
MESTGNSFHFSLSFVRSAALSRNAKGTRRCRLASSRGKKRTVTYFATVRLSLSVIYTHFPMQIRNHLLIPYRLQDSVSLSQSLF